MRDATWPHCFERRCCKWSFTLPEGRTDPKMSAAAGSRIIITESAQVSVQKEQGAGNIKANVSLATCYGILFHGPGAPQSERRGGGEWGSWPRIKAKN